jgi:[ribosomal protein S5]-alanine N-acetyltransferase
MIIKSKKFMLRPYKKGDEESLRENINDNNVTKHMSSRLPFPYKVKDAKWWINNCLKLSKEKKPSAVNFAIDIDGKVIGGVGLMYNSERYRAEIGYWLGKKYWNSGIMTEAVKLVTDFGFKKLKLKRIYATVFTKNKVSVHILKKNGYKFEGLMKNYHMKGGKMIDALMYAKTRWTR